MHCTGARGDAAAAVGAGACACCDREMIGLQCCARARGNAAVAVGHGQPARGVVGQKQGFSAAQERVATLQSLSGTGSLRVGAEFISKFLPGRTVYLSNPTWCAPYCLVNPICGTPYTCPTPPGGTVYLSHPTCCALAALQADSKHLMKLQSG